MIPKPIINILSQFDDLLGAVKALNNNDETLAEVANEIKLLKLWREEVESEKQSIYIIGKTSTGKSEFHNLLLDIDNKKDRLFKTSTKVETGIIQTLEHCPSRKDAFAEIFIRDSNEFKRLVIPNQLHSFLIDSTLIFPLDNCENVSFFRDNIIAKSDSSSSFDLIKAVERVNIKFPLKYLKRNKIIDTPGLASSISITDVNVKEQFQGKSYILWFLDGSKRTLSDSLTLLAEEKQLVNNNVDRISFIVNKFDLMEYDDDENRKEEVLKRKQELTDKLNRELYNIFKKQESGKIYFTSFKKPNQKFANKNTYQIIEELEDSLIFIEKESRHKNIHSLITVLSKSLNKIKENVFDKNLNSIGEEINTLELEKKKILKLKRDSLVISGDTQRYISKAQNSIIRIKKEDNLNTRERFYTYLKNFEIQLGNSCREIDNSISRIDTLKLHNYYSYMHHFKKFRKYTFKEEESIWKKFVADAELEEKNINLKRYVQKKLDSFDSLSSLLEENINTECKIELEKYDKKIHIKSEQLTYYDKRLKFIVETEEKINELDAHLLKDIELRVSHWKPDETGENLENFLFLYSMLQEHNIIEKKII